MEFETGALGKVTAAVVAQEGNARRGRRFPVGRSVVIELVYTRYEIALVFEFVQAIQMLGCK